MNMTPTGTIALGGDLNNIFNTYDSSCKNRKVQPPTRLVEFLSTNELQDVWRVMHPKTIDYTYYSHAKNTYSRIDYILISGVGVGNINKNP